jgi:hypothetical protein
MKRALLLCLPVLCIAACGPKIDLAKGVAVESVSTGWADGGMVAGKNRVVPALSFKLKNVSDQHLGTLQVNAVFRRVDDPGEWSTGFLAAAANRLAPGTETGTLTVMGQQGYTGIDDREALLRNSHFVDAKVDLFAKSGSGGWTRIGEYPIARQLTAP